MREIMFRGKCTDGGAWVWGKGIDVNSNDAYILQGWMDCDTGICGVDEIEVVPETVGQYTGLTDINGKKIFEGDIIKAYFEPQNFKNPNYAIGSVIFENGTFKVVVHVSKKSIEYKVFEKEDITAYSIEHNFLDRYYVLEVIGNIHDDPELLMRAVE